MKNLCSPNKRECELAKNESETGWKDFVHPTEGNVSWQGMKMRQVEKIFVHPTKGNVSWQGMKMRQVGKNLFTQQKGT